MRPTASAALAGLAGWPHVRPPGWESVRRIRRLGLRQRHAQQHLLHRGRDGREALYRGPLLEPKLLAPVERQLLAGVDVAAGDDEAVGPPVAVHLHHAHRGLTNARHLQTRGLRPVRAPGHRPGVRARPRGWGGH